MKQAWLSKIAGTALICCTFVTSATAARPDFEICEGLTGAAWGLCRGGVAAGCPDGAGNPTACMRIEDNYVSVTGRDAPWITPTVTCPCDYMVDVPIDTAWVGVTDAVFNCQGDEAFIIAFSEESNLPQLTAVRTTEAGPACAAVPSNGAGNTRDIDDAELSVCRDDLIQYGLSLKAAAEAISGFDVLDECSEILAPLP